MFTLQDPIAFSHRNDPLHNLRWNHNASQVRSPSKNTRLSQRTLCKRLSSKIRTGCFFEKVSCFGGGPDQLGSRLYTHSLTLVYIYTSSPDTTEWCLCQQYVKTYCFVGFRDLFWLDFTHTHAHLYTYIYINSTLVLIYISDTPYCCLCCTWLLRNWECCESKNWRVRVWQCFDSIDILCSQFLSQA